MLVADGLLNSSEADALLEFTRQQAFETTSVVLRDGGTAPLNHTVTSQISPKFQGTHPAATLLEARIEQLSSLPRAWFEGLASLRYDRGDYFRAHLDVHTQPGRPTTARVATCLVYLTDFEAGEGGETYFPWARPAARDGEAAPWRAGPPMPSCAAYVGKDVSTQDEATRSAYDDGSDGWTPPADELGSLGVGVTPRKGRALLFWNRRADGLVDVRSRHVGCPTLVAKRKEGVTQWIRYGCDDGAADATMRAKCAAWARAGECSSNPTYMRERCRRACGLCGCDDMLQPDHRGGGGSAQCTRWAAEGECTASNKAYMREYCRRSCGLC